LLLKHTDGAADILIAFRPRPVFFGLLLLVLPAAWDYKGCQTLTQQLILFTEIEVSFEHSTFCFWSVVGLEPAPPRYGTKCPERSNHYTTPPRYVLHTSVSSAQWLSGLRRRVIPTSRDAGGESWGSRFAPDLSHKN
jgi:hypothetical protein